jgi:hypothetical protein
MSMFFRKIIYAWRISQGCSLFCFTKTNQQVWASLGIVWFVTYYGPESDKKNGQAIFMKPKWLYRSLCPVPIDDQRAYDSSSLCTHAYISFLHLNHSIFLHTRIYYVFVCFFSIRILYRSKHHPTWMCISGIATAKPDAPPCSQHTHYHQYNLYIYIQLPYTQNVCIYIYIYVGVCLCQCKKTCIEYIDIRYTLFSVLVFEKHILYTSPTCPAGSQARLSRALLAPPPSEAGWIWSWL